MIFTHVHTHRWWRTSQLRHGSRVFECAVCGDRAFGTDLDMAAGSLPDKRRSPLPPTDVPGAIDYA